MFSSNKKMTENAFHANMNRRQKLQLILAGVGAILIVVWIVLWLISGEMKLSVILGILSNALLIIGMLVSYRAEERLKKAKEIEQKKDDTEG